MNRRVRIFVSGITDAGDAVEVCLLGCDGVGFDFRSDSPRVVRPSQAREIGERLPPLVARVGRFGAEPVIRVLEVARQAGLSAVWFDGEPPASTDALSPVPWIGTVSYRPGMDPRSFRGMDCTTFVLRPEGWGTGRPDWGAVRDAAVYGRMILMSVSPEDAEWAVERARPHGLCLAEDYEFEPGRVDLERVEDLVDSVRAAEHWLGPGNRR